MTPEEEGALAVTAQAATPSQDALWRYWLQQRYTAQQSAHGWPPPEPEGPFAVRQREIWPPS